MATASEASQQANRSGLDPLRLVVIFLLLTSITLALFFAHVLGVIWGSLGLPNSVVIPGPDWDVPTLIGLVLGLGLGVLGWVHQGIRGRALESASELMKVTWPTWSETKVSTVAVVVASLVAAVILFGIDTLAYQIMVDWLPALWRNL